MQLPSINMSYMFAPKWMIIYLLAGSICLDIAIGIIVYFGVGNLPVSLVYRVTILGIFILSLIRQHNIHSSYIKLVIMVWCLSFCFWLLSYGFVPLVVEINNFLRCLFSMCITVLTLSALRQADHDGDQLIDLVIKGLLFYAFISASFIVFSAVTGIGNLTYGKWAFGFKSFFTGGNDIGLAMLICLSVAWGQLWHKESFKLLLVVMVITIGISLIGSRAAWGGVIGVTVSFALAFLFFKKSQSRVTNLIKVMIMVVVVGGGSFAAKVIYDNLEALAVTMERVTELLDGVSPRVRLERSGHYVLNERDGIYDVFGQGTRFYYDVKEHFSWNNRSYGEPPRHTKLQYKLIEQDPFDLYGTYGIVLGSMIFGYHLFFWLWSIKLYLRKRSVDYFTYTFAITMFIFHGTIAGHAMSSPQVGTVIGSIYALMWFRAQKDDQQEKQQAKALCQQQDLQPPIKEFAA